MISPPKGSPPRVAGGCRAWITADPIAFYPLYQSFGGARVTANNDKVGYVPPFWYGSTAWRNDDADEKPTFKTNQINGRAALDFDGAEDYIDCAAFTPALRAYEVWCVCKWADDVVTEQRPWSCPDDSLGIVRLECDALAAATTWSTCQQQLAHAVNSGAAWHAWRCVSDPGAAFFQRDGITVASQGAPPYMPLLAPSRYRLGGSYSAGLLLKGQIAEFFEVPYLCSAGQADDLWDWIDTRYALL